MCNLFGCHDECTENAYCDYHYQANIDKAYEDGRQAGYAEAKAEQVK